jgi:hypothetical protein
MSSQPTKGEDDKRKAAQEELSRSLERELGLLAEERKDRARRLGIEHGLAVSSRDN